MQQPHPDLPLGIAPGEARREWRQHWPLVVAATAGMSISAVHLYSMGALLDPIAQETGWTRTQITFGQTLSAAISILLAPVCGVLMDRFGPRRIAIPGMIVFLLGVMAFATVGNSLVQWYALWALLSLGLLGLKPNVWCGAVSGRFVASRALAFAVVISGTSLGTAIVPSVTVLLYEHYGWRGAYVGLGVLWAVTVLPLCWFYLRTPQDDAKPRIDGGSAAPAPDVPGVSVGQGLRSRAFAGLALAGFLFGICIVAIMLHFVPMMIDRGIDRTTAAALAGIVGGCSIIGRLIAGVLLDRFSGRLVGSLSLLLPVLPISLLLGADVGIAGVAILAILLGLSVGSELDVLAYLATRHFGLRNYGTLFGFIISALAASTSAGPILASWLRDTTGSYDALLWAALPCFAISALAIACLPAYPKFARDR